MRSLSTCEVCGHSKSVAKLQSASRPDLTRRGPGATCAFGDTRSHGSYWAACPTVPVGQTCLLSLWGGPLSNHSLLQAGRLAQKSPGSSYGPSPGGPDLLITPPPTPALRTTDWRGEQGPGTGVSKDVSGRTRSEQRSFCGPHPRRPPDSRPQAGPLLPAGTEPTSRPQQRGSPSQGCERVN